MSEDYIKGQEDLIKYIKERLLIIVDTSKDEDVMFDVINLLNNLKPKQR